MKVTQFEVVSIYENYDEDEHVEVRIERTKDFDEYQQAREYFEKRRVAMESRYTPDEAHYSEIADEGNVYRQEQLDYAMPNGGWMVLYFKVRILNW